jgi:hypothetical protein
MSASMCHDYGDFTVSVLGFSTKLPRLQRYDLYFYTEWPAVLLSSFIKLFSRCRGAQ